MKFYWRIILTAYGRALDKHPMITEMTTSGLIWCLGDLATQRIESNYHNQKTIIPDGADDKEIDWKRTYHQTLYAAFIWGPLGHKWYQVLDRVATTIVKRSNKLPGGGGMVSMSSRPRFVVTKLVLEMVALHPISLLAFFGVIGTLNQESPRAIQEQLQRDFFPTLCLEVAMWTPVDALNFAFVPVRHQLLVVNCACFLESVGLSFVKHNGFSGLKSAILGTKEETQI
jgi:protein Mpv17